MAASNAETLSSLQKKYDALRQQMEQMGSVLVAFSGGIDSTVLLKVAHDVLGENAAAITARSCLVPQREIDEAELFCEDEGIEHLVVDVDPFKIEGFAQNPPDRCYICKKVIFSQMLEASAENGHACLCEGSNASDLADYRPGRRAIEELGVRSPLLEVGMNKDEIRLLGLSLGIEFWDKPSSACLASRFATGSTITLEGLHRVERSEELLLDAGFERVRVRSHGDLARIEVAPDEMDDLYEFARESDLVEQLHQMGFRYAAFDLDGYRTGSMNAQ